MEEEKKSKKSKKSKNPPRYREEAKNINIVSLEDDSKLSEILTELINKHIPQNDKISINFLILRSAVIINQNAPGNNNTLNPTITINKNLTPPNPSPKPTLNLTSKPKKIPVKKFLSQAHQKITPKPSKSPKSGLQNPRSPSQNPLSPTKKFFLPRIPAKHTYSLTKDHKVKVSIQPSQRRKTLGKIQKFYRQKPEVKLLSSMDKAPWVLTSEIQKLAELYWLKTQQPLNQIIKLSALRWLPLLSSSVGCCPDSLKESPSDHPERTC